MKGVVTKVTAGEADAGIVYITDVTAAGDKAEAVDIPADINVVAKYPIASVKTSTNADVDQAFIDFLLGPDGQAIMAKYGFMAAMTVTAPVRRGRRPPAGRRRAPPGAGPPPGDRRDLLLRPPVHRPAVEGAMGRRLVDPHVAPVVGRAAAVAVVLVLGDALFAIVFGVPLAWLLARVVVSGAERSASTVHALDGAAAGRGRRRAVLRARSPRSRRSVPRPVVRHHVAVHHGGRDRRPDLRGHAVPRDHGRGGVPPGRHSLRGRRPDPGRLAVVRVPPGDAAGDPARAHRRRRAGMGARPRRVRRDDHVRRKLPGPNPDDAPRHLPRRTRPIPTKRSC